MRVSNYVHRLCLCAVLCFMQQSAASASEKVDSVSSADAIATPHPVSTSQASLSWYSLHAQATIIAQMKPAFHSSYSGVNSLSSTAESATSFSSTLFAGLRISSHTELYCDPELSGGTGLSSAVGVANAFNGETYRIGSTQPTLRIARLFMRQLIDLSKEQQWQEGDDNVLEGMRARRLLILSLGKVSITDFFDDNTYSHDPRSQFMTWSLMSQGAWDYPANTRGYTPSFVAEYISPMHELRYACSLMPTTANGSEMDWNLLRSQSQTLEWTLYPLLPQRGFVLRSLVFFTQARMGNYEQSVALHPDHADVTLTRADGRSKYGAAFNVEYELRPSLGMFVRLSWNDGRNETWAFTEIDNSLSTGLDWQAKAWNRPNDHFGLAFVSSGISTAHQRYLAAGGSGFMLGDGTLRYARESMVEAYYGASFIAEHLQLSAATQVLFNPGYNLDRHGPASAFSLRLHLKV